MSVVFLGKKFYSQSATLHPGVQMGICELNAEGWVGGEGGGNNLAMN